MPHLWMFLLQTLTPPGHEVLLIDGNAQPMNEAALVQFVLEQKIGLVGIGAMTRMVAKAYRMADAVRATGVPVVMGGPHVTEEADEALGRNGGPRHADAVALGEADETWPKIVADAACGKLREIYEPTDEFGQEPKPSLQSYPTISWESMDLAQFNIVPKAMAPVLRRIGGGWATFRIIPVESGRHAYGCEFCTVTGFFGDAIRFRSNQNVVDELLRLKARARSENGQMVVFFIDDNFAINVKRTKSLLRDIIAADAQVHWIAQISANLLRDTELLDLIAASGGRWVFIGMESIDPVNLASVNKGFNKPGEYAAVLQKLADRNIYAITSFIFGMDNDTQGVAERTLEQIRSWPPGLPVFGALTPLPATPLYERLQKGRTADPSEALAGVSALCHGAHAAEDDRRGSACGDQARMGSFLQRGRYRTRRELAARQEGQLPHQHSGGAPLFPRDLFPANGAAGMGENHLSKPAKHLAGCKGQFSAIGVPGLRRDERRLPIPIQWYRKRLRFDVPGLSRCSDLCWDF